MSLDAGFNSFNFFNFLVLNRAHTSACIHTSKLVFPVMLQNKVSCLANTFFQGERTLCYVKCTKEGASKPAVQPVQSRENYVVVDPNISSEKTAVLLC